MKFAIFNSCGLVFPILCLIGSMFIFPFEDALMPLKQSTVISQINQKQSIPKRETPKQAYGSLIFVEEMFLTFGADAMPFQNKPF